MSHSLKRARTQDQKHFRRQQILEAAEQHFHDVGYEAFSMASLAKLAGVVKGTLYLYFKTREEVFLTLYNRSLSRYSETFLGSCQHDMTDHDYVRTLYTTAMDDAHFVPLLTRLEHVIEHNVSIESLIASKRHFIDRLDHLAKAAAPILNLTPEQSLEMVKTLGVLLVGAARTDQGPSLQGEDIPQDVQALMDSFSSERLFIKNACRIIEGIRAGNG